MKNLFTLLIFGCLFLSCSDDSSEATYDNPSTTALASTPEANKSHDSSYKGIYKGIVIGNISGALYINLYNDNEIMAKLQTDNQKMQILKNVPITNTADKALTPDFKKFRFENENVSFEIKLDDTGNNISISNFKFFSDSDLKVCLIKEKSTSLIKCYTGVFEGGHESGRINFTSDGQLNIKGLSKELNSTTFTDLSGEINMVRQSDVSGRDDGSDSLVGFYQLNANLHFGEVSGLLEEYRFDGDWKYLNEKIGSWTATRIL